MEKTLPYHCRIHDCPTIGVLYVCIFDYEIPWIIAYVCCICIDIGCNFICQIVETVLYAFAPSAGQMILMDIWQDNNYFAAAMENALSPCFLQSKEVCTENETAQARIKRERDGCS